MTSLLLFGVLVAAAAAWHPPPEMLRKAETLSKRSGLETRNFLGLMPTKQKSDSANEKMKRRDINRVSFKECNLDPGLRLDCGHYGMEREECERRECCWEETDSPGTPWCYHSIPTMSDMCIVDGNERVECGSFGIRKEQCMALNCCWQPSSDYNEPWCYHYKEMEVQPGECGVPANPPNVRIPTSRIVGGIEAKPHSWPWQVSMQVQGFGHFCGASIINSRWILTAAHCESGFYYGDIVMVVGAHGVSDEAVNRQEIRVMNRFPHENYNEATIDNDIMLVQLAEDIIFSDDVSPICLPDASKEPRPGQRCYVTGWGTTMLHGDSPEMLQQVMAPVIAAKTCSEWYLEPENWYGSGVDVPPITDNMICAGYEEGGRGSCHGDSGGPFVCYGEDHWELRGVVSWGGPCAHERTPSVFARVSRYIDWIQNILTLNQN